MLGKKDLINKLFGNMAIDNSEAYEIIKWKPPYTFDEGIKRTINLKN